MQVGRHSGSSLLWTPLGPQEVSWLFCTHLYVAGTKDSVQIKGGVFTLEVLNREVTLYCPFQNWPLHKNPLQVPFPAELQQCHGSYSRQHTPLSVWWSESWRLHPQPPRYDSTPQEPWESHMTVLWPLRCSRIKPLYWFLESVTRNTSIIRGPHGKFNQKIVHKS